MGPGRVDDNKSIDSLALSPVKLAPESFLSLSPAYLAACCLLCTARHAPQLESRSPRFGRLPVQGEATTALSLVPLVIAVGSLASRSHLTEHSGDMQLLPPFACKGAILFADYMVPKIQSLTVQMQHYDAPPLNNLVRPAICLDRSEGSETWHTEGIAARSIYGIMHLCLAQPKIDRLGIVIRTLGPYKSPRERKVFREHANHCILKE